MKPSHAKPFLLYTKYQLEPNNTIVSFPFHILGDSDWKIFEPLLNLDTDPITWKDSSITSDIIPHTVNDWLSIINKHNNAPSLTHIKYPANISNETLGVILIGLLIITLFIFF